MGIDSVDIIIDACNESIDSIIDQITYEDGTVDASEAIEYLLGMEKRLEDFLMMTIEIDDGIKLAKEIEEDKAYAILSIHDLSNLVVCNAIIPSIWYSDTSNIDTEEILYAANHNLSFITTLGDMFNIPYRDKKTLKRVIENLYNMKMALRHAFIEMRLLIVDLADTNMVIEADLASETAKKSLSNLYNIFKLNYNEIILDIISDINFNLPDN